MPGFVAELTKSRKRPNIEESVMAMIRCSSMVEPSVLDLALTDLSNRMGPRVYSVFFKAMFHLSTPPKEAKLLWKKILDFHNNFKSNFSESVDFRVSSLYYLINVAELLHNPVVVEAEQYQKLLNESLTDEMTGLHNFRFFQKMIERDFEHAKRYNQPLSIIFIDIDHFKKFNDLYGHTEGDQVVRFVAKAIQSCMRWSDWACRYGGEEFVIVAAGTTKTATLPLVERIRKKLSRLDAAPLHRNGHFITISAGVACFPHDAQRIEELINKADEALYLAKERGRNRVEIYPSPSELIETSEPQQIFKSRLQK